MTTLYGPLQVVNTSNIGNQYQATDAQLTSGKIIVTWYDDNLKAVRAQFFDALGNPIGAEFAPKIPFPGDLGDELPRVAARPNNGYAIAYVAIDPSNTTNLDVGTSFFKGTDSSSLPGSFLTFPLGIQTYISSKPFGSGNIFVYEDDAANGGDVIYGSDITHPHTANTATTGLQTWPDITALAGNTSYVISWWDDQTKLVKFRLFDSSDNPLTPEVAAGSVGTAASTGFRSNAVAALTGGNFVVAWRSSVGGGDVIQASVYNSNGVAVKAGIQVEAGATADQGYPSAVGLSDGGFAVAWSDFTTGGSIALRTFDASGNPTSSEFVVDGAGHQDSEPQLTLLADGRIALTWEANQGVPQDMLGRHTEMQIVDPRSSGVTLTPDPAGSDLVGTPFDDAFIDGPGDDRFTGNGGLDTVSFINATGGITVNLGLSTTQVIGGGMGTDTLSGIHGIVGSSYDDVITGDASFDSIALGSGNDTVQAGSGGSFIVGNGGNDQIIGGAGGGPSGLGNTIYALGGNDYLQGGTGSPSDVLVATGAGNDSFYGGSGNNYIVGGTGKNTIVGGGGALQSLYGNGSAGDYIVGGSSPTASNVLGELGTGSAQLWGGPGNNYEVGGAGNDLVVGGNSSDYLFGANGDDTLYGGNGTDYIYPGPGNDFIWTDNIGSQSSDYVYEGVGTGVDTVADFTPGDGANHDVLVLTKADSEITSFADVQAKAFQAGVYTVLPLSATDDVFLYNVQPSQLTANDFIFA